MDPLPVRIRTLRRRLVFTWFVIGPAAITIYIALCKAVEPRLVVRGPIAPDLVAYVGWVLIGACVLGTAEVFWWGRALMADEPMRRSAAKEPTPGQTDPLGFRVLATQVVMGAGAEFVVLTGMLMFLLGAPFDRFMSFAIYSLGLNIYIGGTIPSRLNKFEEVALSVEEGMSDAGEPHETV